MRLFVAILFEESLLDTLCTVIQNLKDASYSGHFTRRENLHLTLAFIGETNRVETIIHTIDGIQQPPFSLTIQGAGIFPCAGSALYWAGISQSNELLTIQTQLYHALRAEVFLLEDRPYLPHLTLGRRVIVKDTFHLHDFSSSIPPLQAKVRTICLIKSEQVHDKRIYTKIHTKSL